MGLIVENTSIQERERRKKWFTHGWNQIKIHFPPIQFNFDMLAGKSTKAINRKKLTWDAERLKMKCLCLSHPLHLNFLPLSVCIYIKTTWEKCWYHYRVPRRKYKKPPNTVRFFAFQYSNFRFANQRLFWLEEQKTNKINGYCVTVTFSNKIFDVFVKGRNNIILKWLAVLHYATLSLGFHVPEKKKN